MHAIRRSARALVAAVGLGALAPSADATWSIIIVDTRTGEIAIGSATCLAGFDLQLKASIVVPGIGAAAAQSFVDQSGQNRVFVYDQMLRGTPPAEIITRLAAFDSGHQTRQYGIVDLRENGRATTFTGTGAGQYRGGVTGRLVGGGPTGGDLVYAVQGNVLTGAPVIEAAEAAIRNAPGDVPEKLMRSMEAAMMMGGDGRCSCRPDNPTGCGAPPDEFVRSAYIGYMVVSRAGDTPGCNGIYRLNAATPVTAISVDVNGDGEPDLITCNQGSSNISVLRNTIASGWATFGLPMNFPVGASPRDVVSGDFNGDGNPDVATASFNIDGISVLRGQASGTFVGRADVTTGDGPIALVPLDADGDGDVDLAVIHQLAQSLVFALNDGAGVFTAGAPMALGAAPAAIAAADLDGDSDTDLVIATGAAPSSLVIARNMGKPGGPVSFVLENTLELGRGVNALATGDLNADGRTDIVALAATDGRVNVSVQNVSGFTSFVEYNFGATGTGISLADATGDGVLDIVGAVRTGARIVMLPGLPGGAFDVARLFPFGQTPGRPVVADLNNDSVPDFACPLQNVQQLVTVRNLGGGMFNDGAGCASGEYWLNFNVANASPNGPDPVPLLRQQLNETRATLRGRTDAVRSLASFDPPALRADGVAGADLLVTLRDWEGAPVGNADERSVRIASPDAAALGIDVGEVESLGGGVYRVRVTAGRALGAARFEVTVQDEPFFRPVILMPSVQLSVVARADWDLSGVVDALDYFAYVDDFLQGRGEFNHDGVHNTQDYFDFLAEFFAP